ncbi:SDR family oxidoreductase [Bordetella sp. BOR01]|uniref:SDR family oxidoreductase n=1 Tax=Bordetella sp. BOR01 TaxID=2854779 RepID=UPI001C460CBD|nr:SDR family oxidoreductase [Bordetella sp. BOR01]MBV7485099.1 SDR family oxidoreductase [Bordetella sp. BOR01]
MTTAAPAQAYLQQFSLAGQVALVTGSARGLGLCIARAMAGCGAHVLINGRNAAAVQDTVAALRNDGLAASALAFDIGDDDAMARAFAQIDAEHGRLDILVNNVGARNRKTLQAMAPAEIRALIDTDLVAGILLAKLAAGRMVPQRAGRLIAITSVVGELARAGDAVYPAAKQGLTGMMRALAAEFGPLGITSNAIAPGTFATETNAAFMANPALHDPMAARNPMGRWGQPEEIAGAAVFLASPAASYVNGQVLTVDGGLSILF